MTESEWTPFGDSEYSIYSPQQCIGSVACNALCCTVGGYLAEIDSVNENRFVTNDLLDKWPKVDGYWIGIEFNGSSRYDGRHRWIRSKTKVLDSLYTDEEPDRRIVWSLKLQCRQTLLEIRCSKFLVHWM